MRAKPFWDVSHAKWVLDTFMKDLSHENDGLIFSPATDVRDNVVNVTGIHIVDPYSLTSLAGVTSCSSGNLQTSILSILNYPSQR